MLLRPSNVCFAPTISSQLPSRREQRHKAPCSVQPLCAAAGEAGGSQAPSGFVIRRAKYADVLAVAKVRMASDFFGTS